MKTDDNLKAAFAGESQAFMRYQAFARAAEKSGQHQVARLFRAIAEAEKVHALNHFAAMGAAGATDKNLKTAIEGETYEFTEMYPEFIKQAQSDGNKKALGSFKDASAVEKVHSVLYGQAMANPQVNDGKFYYVCPVCGNTVIGKAPDKCSICGADGKKFMKIE